ncbi:MAG: DUF1127 domain-containing protein [Rhodobacter sp.]|nr:DUF1127 domain-containing protein [Rhodobacter sp.]MCY4167482.1 DUF1127 domain-containing protein [Rhodobacter sp.]MCY4241314.1 DUF1127 domain-containing protein [Rhodobacter sp.]
MHAKQITSGLYLPFVDSVLQVAQLAKRAVDPVIGIIAHEWTMHILDDLSDEELKDIGLNRRDLPAKF